MPNLKVAPYSAPDPFIDLSFYHIILVNTSGGKDSQTMMRRVVRLAIEQGVLDRVYAIHCDLGRVEWKGTKELAADHAAHYGLRFYTVRRELGDLLDHALERGLRGKPAFPGYSTRWCTSDHKTSQVYKSMTALAGEYRIEHPGFTGPVRFLNVLGNRAEESEKRRKQASFEWNAGASNQTVRHVWNWLPIHTMTETEVWDDVRASGVPYHRAYDLGMPRLSCCFCIYAGEDALVVAAQHNPELADAYVDVERQTGFRFKEHLSMEQVVEIAKTRTVTTTVANWAA